MEITGKRVGIMVACASIALAAFVAAAPDRQVSKVEKIGTTYPIAEEHAIKEIQARLQEKQNNGQLEQIQREIEKHVSHHALNPEPVDWLKTAEKGSVRYFEPVYTLPETIYDQDGNIIAPGGTVVKPLEVAPIPFKMLFFDGRDDKQMAMAEKLAAQYGESFMPILTAGRWDEASEKLGMQVYFDQQGRMSKGFQLSEVPSLVMQSGNQIRVEVMKP